MPCVECLTVLRPNVKLHLACCVVQEERRVRGKEEKDGLALSLRRLSFFFRPLILSLPLCELADRKVP